MFLNLFFNAIRLTKWVIKLLLLILLQYNLFLNDTRLNKCVIKQSIDVFLYFILFLTNVKLKKYMWHSCFYISVFKVYCPDKYKTQRICDEAIDHSLAALKLFLIGLLQVKWLKNVILFCTHMMVYPFLIKTMVISYFFVMKWLFLV